MKLSLILEAIDKWSKPAEKAAKTTQKLTKATEALDHASTDAGRSTRKFWGDADRGERLGRKLGATIRSVAERDFTRLRSAIDQTGQALDAQMKKAGVWAVKKGVTAVGWALGIATTTAATIAGGFVTDMIRNASEFEQYKVQLATSLGSLAAAEKALDFIKRFATKTPYEIGEVTKAFVQAKQEGIDPFNGAMDKIADAAGGLNKDFVETVMAVGDASRNQYERLLDTGITASSKGGMVALTYIDKQGKSVTKKVKKQALDVQKAVLDIFDARFRGGTVAQSQTLEGIVGNLKDEITSFELNVAGRGIFGRLKNALKEALDWFGDDKNQKQIDEWAQKVGTYLNLAWDRGVKFAKEVDWEAVAGGIAAIGKALITVVELLGKAARLGDKLSSIPFTPMWLARNAGDGILKTITDGAPPPWADPLGVWQPKSPRQPPSKPASNAWSLPTTTTEKAWQNALTPKAKVELHVTTDRGVTVAPRKIAATGLDVGVNTGRAMGPFA